MKTFGCIVILFLANALAQRILNIKFNQHDYHVTFERVTTISYNTKYMRHSSVMSFKYNRTCLAINATLNFKVDVGSDMDVVLQTYRFASNEYRLFPLRVGGKFCDFFKLDAGGIQDLTKCGNWTGCNFLKDTVYHWCNFVFDESKLPPLVPNGRYMLIHQFVFHSNLLLDFGVYVTIARPEVK